MPTFGPCPPVAPGIVKAAVLIAVSAPAPKLPVPFQALVKTVSIVRSTGI